MKKKILSNYFTAKEYKFCLIFIILFFLNANCYFYSEQRIAIIDYYGFDFSTGRYNTDTSKNDIYIVNFNPSIEDDAPGQYYYFFLKSDDNKQYIKSFGNETFNYINRISPNFEWDSISQPIKVGYLYVAKCLDGFVKFKVRSIKGSNIYNVEVFVIYKFTKDSLF